MSKQTKEGKDGREGYAKLWTSERPAGFLLLSLMDISYDGIKRVKRSRRVEK